MPIVLCFLQVAVRQLSRPTNRTGCCRPVRAARLSNADTHAGQFLQHARPVGICSSSRCYYSHRLQQSNEGSLQEWTVSLDFGQKLGVIQGKAMLNSGVFASQEDMLYKQILAVTNLVPQDAIDDSLVEAAVLTVAGRALLQPAQAVANGYKLA